MAPQAVCLYKVRGIWEQYCFIAMLDSCAYRFAGKCSVSVSPPFQFSLHSTEAALPTCSIKRQADGPRTTVRELRVAFTAAYERLFLDLSKLRCCQESSCADRSARLQNVGDTKKPEKIPFLFLRPVAHFSGSKQFKRTYTLQAFHRYLRWLRP